MLTPLTYFEMTDNVKWEAYKNEITAKEPSPEIFARGVQAWQSLANTSLVVKRLMTATILTANFLTALEKVLDRETMEELWFAPDGDDWKEYCDNVERVFSQFVYKRPFEQTDERDVQGQWRRKWEFVKFDHGANYPQKPLMLLTPLSVETLASALGKVDQALGEVSGLLSNGTTSCAIRPHSNGTVRSCSDGTGRPCSNSAGRLRSNGAGQLRSNGAGRLCSNGAGRLVRMAHVVDRVLTVHVVDRVLMAYDVLSSSHRMCAIDPRYLQIFIVFELDRPGGSVLLHRSEVRFRGQGSVGVGVALYLT
jgi:hypothetical protein